jgi:hypothetical protein
MTGIYKRKRVKMIKIPTIFFKKDSLLLRMKGGRPSAEPATLGGKG